MAYCYDRRDSRTASFGKFALSVGETFENDKWRVHRYRDSIRVTDLLGAGKRGKQCKEWVLVGNRDLPLESVAMEFVMLAKRGSDPTRMDQSMAEQKEIGAEVHEMTRKGVDVKPGNFQKLLVRGALITVEADYDSYSIQDITDEMNEPTCIARGKRSVYQFYRWVKDNARAIQSMSMHQAMEAMKGAGIDYHYFCAVD